ncbi:MAG: DUF6494 family protein [Pseudomonadota bacterium]
MADDFNLSIRKFLKHVGVTSQAEIEGALRAMGGDTGKSYPVKIVLTSEALGLEHEVTGTISADGADGD